MKNKKTCFLKKKEDMHTLCISQAEKGSNEAKTIKKNTHNKAPTEERNQKALVTNKKTTQSKEKEKKKKKTFSERTKTTNK